MRKMTSTDRASSSGDRWRCVDIRSPRRLKGRTYAMILRRDGVEEVIARHVTIEQALVIALEHQGGYGAAMLYRDWPALREYVIGRRSLGGGPFQPVMRGALQRTARLETDHVRALEFFEEMLEDEPGVFFHGRLERASHRAMRRAKVTSDGT